MAQLFGMGNPLLDISAVVEEALFQEYELSPNNAILAEAKHMPVYQELITKYEVQYIAGGAAQNAIRVAQWMLQQPGMTTFTGCVGTDAYAQKLRNAATQDGVTILYVEDATTPTGCCACLINKQGERSLCANIAAANNFKLESLKSPHIWAAVEAARMYYIEGYFLTVSPPSMLALATHAAEHNKIFSINLSAVFLPQFFSEPLLQVMPYVDFLFGNESEFRALSTQQGWGTDDTTRIARKAAELPKVNAARRRVVVCTQGSHATVVASTWCGTGTKFTSYPVTPLAREQLVDTNGAGDAFVGGFLSQLVQGKDIDVCVNAGHYAAREVIQQSGCTFPAKPSFSA